MKIEKLSLQSINKWSDQIKELMKEATLKSFPDNLPDSEYYDSSISKLESYLSEDKAVVFLAVDENILLGYIWCHEINRLKKRRFHISSFAVTPSCQKRGIGTMLVNMAFDYAKDNGFAGIDLLVTDTNISAKQFYLKNGFEIERLLMSKDL